MPEMSNAELMQKLRETMTPAEMEVLGQFASTLGVENADDVIESMQDMAAKMTAVSMKVVATWLRKLADDVVAAVENNEPSIALVASTLMLELMSPAGEVISSGIRMLGQEFSEWVTKAGVSKRAAVTGDNWVKEIDGEYKAAVSDMFHEVGVTMDVAEGMRETLRQDEKYKRM